jgi:phasin family protein
MSKKNSQATKTAGVIQSPAYEKGAPAMSINGSAEQMDKVAQNLIQACDEINANYRQSMDAVVESTAAITRGCDEISRNWSGFMQEQMERALNTGKTMMTAKSIKEIADLQNEFIKDCFDQWMAGTGRISEISARVTQQAFEPVARHANDTICKVTQKARQQGRAA